MAVLLLLFCMLLQVLPLPDGVVIGRCNLQQVGADARAAVQQALQEAAKRLTSSSSTSSSGPGPGPNSSVPGTTALESPAAEDVGSSQQVQPSNSSAASSSSNAPSSSNSPLSSTEGLAAIASLNTVAERGVALQVRDGCG